MNDEDKKIFNRAIKQKIYDLIKQFVRLVGELK